MRAGITIVITAAIITTIADITCITTAIGCISSIITAGTIIITVIITAGITIITEDQGKPRLWRGFFACRGFTWPADRFLFAVGSTSWLAYVGLR